MTIEQLQNVFFDSDNFSAMYYSLPRESNALQIALDSMQAMQVYINGLDMGTTLLLARGKHPLLIMRNEAPLERNYSADELIHFLSATPDDKPIQCMLWFYLLTTEQIKLTMKFLRVLFSQRNTIRLTQGSRQSYFLSAKKDELLTQISYRPAPMPGIIPSA